MYPLSYTGEKKDGNENKRDKGFKPLWVIFQGIFIVGVGMFISIASLGSQPRHISGTIQNQLWTGDAELAYYVQINTAPKDLFMLDKTLPSASANSLSKNERVDLVYIDTSPKRIIALQTYGLDGRPGTKYTSDTYRASQNASPLSNISLDIGLLLILVGALWAGTAVFVIVTSRRHLYTAHGNT